LTFRSQVTNLTLTHNVGAATQPLLRAPKLIATGDSSELDLAHACADLHVVLEIPESQVESRELSRYIPRRAPISLGYEPAHAELRFEAWLAERRATGAGTLRADHLDLRLAKMRVHGRASLHAKFASYDFDTRRIDRAMVSLSVLDGTLASTVD